MGDGYARRCRDGLTGSQAGTEDVNVWFDVVTGLPLRNQRVITVHSGSLIGGVTWGYTGPGEVLCSNREGKMAPYRVCRQRAMAGRMVH